jgi:hypothetical protein
MTFFLSSHAFAAARGEGLGPELQVLFERAATDALQRSRFGKTACCSQGRILLVKWCRGA